jgi:nickel-dependent lactate racemase
MTTDRHVMSLNIPDQQRIAVHRHPISPPLADPTAALQNALENPMHFPALRRALTPDDRIAIAVDDELHDLPGLLAPLLEYLGRAHIAPQAITLVCPSPGPHSWVQHLPPAFAEVKIEDHDPLNRDKLSYLATTRRGKRLYLNRTAVDAEQLIVLSRRFYDPLLGHGGAEGMIYPWLSDEPTRKAALANLSMATPGDGAWPLRKEAVEIAGLVGAPFFVQIIEGEGEGDAGSIAHVLAGPLASSQDGQRLLDERWRVEIEEPADIVIATVASQGERHGLAALARALASASRVVKSDGRIVLIYQGELEIGETGQILRQADSPAEVHSLIEDNRPDEAAAAFQWAQAAGSAHLFVWTGLPDETVEEMFATPVSNAAEIQRLARGGRCLELADADRTLAVVRAE